VCTVTDKRVAISHGISCFRGTYSLSRSSGFLERSNLSGESSRDDNENGNGELSAMSRQADTTARSVSLACYFHRALLTGRLYLSRLRPANFFGNESSLDIMSARACNCSGNDKADSVADFASTETRRDRGMNERERERERERSLVLRSIKF